MKIRLIILLSLIVSFAMAQPAQVKKAAKSMFKITTFNHEGVLLHTGYGVFVSAEGECLGTWEPFVGANSATIIDAQGRKYDVDCLIGANEIYNVSKFRVKVPADKKMSITPLAVATTQIPVGGETWFVEYDTKNPTCKKYTPTKVETFQDTLPYYIFEQTADEELAGSPFLTSTGELIGLMEPSKKRTDLYCASSQYAMAMTPTGLTGNEATIRQTSIRVALPKDKNQALLAMVMAQRSFNSPQYLATTEEFISMFPDAYEGYTAKAEYLILNNKCDEADVILQESIVKSDKKDEAHFAYSKIIFEKISTNPDSTFTLWTYDKAMEEIDAAYAISPLPAYNLHKGKLQFARKQYDDAYNTFIDVSKTNMRSGDCFYYASLCLQNTNAPQEQIIAMLDSAVACYATPYKAEAAPYLLIRGRYLDAIGQSKKAVADYNSYEEAMAKRVSAEFYYQKEQVEFRAKYYKQAIDDISKAVILNPQECLYLAELALINIKLNQLDDGIKAAQLCMERFPEYGDGYAIYGLALILKGNKKEGMGYLEKAKAMDSQMADQLIEKYK